MEKFRPAIHYSPSKGWINDPNGLVFDGENYHLFTQKYPDAKHWGPMHWGHAMSRDLLHWEHKPIALKPDNDGMAFSGSALIDSENISGLGKDTLIALYTNHGADEYQSQFVAYSVDRESFVKYQGNPVIDDKNFKDFRDPKFFYDKKSESWRVVLAAGDRVCFYKTEDLLHYEKTGEFSSEVDIGGVWECPDMLSFDTDEGTVWVLIISRGATPGEKGSETGYFVGSFDGESFKAIEPDVFRLVDDGPDNYAAVSFSGVKDRVLHIGWMMNWNYPFTDKDYASDPFCGTMTIPREWNLHSIDGKYYLSSLPCREITDYFTELSHDEKKESECFAVSALCEADAEIILSNELGESLRFGIDSGYVFADRSATDCDCFDGFASYCESERKIGGSCMLKAIFDSSSLELFADDGLTVITMNAFPKKPFNKIVFKGAGEHYVVYPKEK